MAKMTEMTIWTVKGKRWHGEGDKFKMTGSIGKMIMF